MINKLLHTGPRRPFLPTRRRVRARRRDERRLVDGEVQRQGGSLPSEPRREAQRGTRSSILRYWRASCEARWVACDRALFLLGYGQSNKFSRARSANEALRMQWGSKTMHMTVRLDATMWSGPYIDMSHLAQSDNIWQLAPVKSGQECHGVLELREVWDLDMMKTMG